MKWDHVDSIKMGTYIDKVDYYGVMRFFQDVHESFKLYLAQKTEF